MAQRTDRLTEGLVHRVYNEYVEMPGLQLSLKQAQRLFGLSESECLSVLDCLIAYRVLVRLPHDRYALASDDTARRRAGRRPPLSGLPLSA